MDRRSRFYQSFKRDRASIVDEHGPAHLRFRNARGYCLSMRYPEMFPESPPQ